jgi:putative membrane protein
VESRAGGERTLILCIDVDDDIGKKARIETPVTGKDANIEAATALSLADPEEADANAMFGAVKLYNRLLNEYSEDTYEVATIAGSSQGGVDADRRVVKELESVLRSFRATGVILVTDGYADEAVLPLVQSRVPITSIQHVVVKHSERLEETWAVIFRYLRQLVEDPYYSRVSLGVPGVMLIIVGILLVFNQLQNAGMILTFVMGLVLLIKGFGWEEKLDIVRLRMPPPDRQLTLAALSVGIILTIVGSIRGIINAWNYVPNPSPPWWGKFSWWLQQSPTLIGHFLLEAIDLIILGAMVSLIGGVAAHYIRKDSKIWQNIVGIIVTFWLRFIAIESAKVLIEPEKTLHLFSPLVIFTIAGVVTTIASVLVIYGRDRNIPFQRRTEKT